MKTLTKLNKQDVISYLTQPNNNGYDIISDDICDRAYSGTLPSGWYRDGNKLYLTRPGCDLYVGIIDHPPQHHKNDYIHIRVSSAEKTEIELSAKKAGLDSISAYLLWLHRNYK